MGSIGEVAYLAHPILEKLSVTYFIYTHFLLDSSDSQSNCSRRH